MRRREVLKTAALLLGTTVTAPVARALQSGGDLTAVSAARAFDAPQKATVDLLADMIIPTTDTPGAVTAGVPDFIATIFQDWYNDAERAKFLEGLAALDEFCRERDGRAFHEAPEATQMAALEAQQAIAEAGGPPSAGPWGSPPFSGPDMPFFATLKELVVLGYYTSEIGATQELNYLVAPGRFDGDVPLAEAGRHKIH